MNNETKTTYSELIIMAMPEGGYIVRQNDSYSNIIPTPLFAASTKQEVLDFINERLSK